jgi:type II secretion system protein G
MSRKGFTLIELLVVISIIGLLATIVMVSLNSAKAKARDARRLSDMKQIQLALEMYYSDYGNYPIRHSYTTSAVGGCGSNWCTLEADLSAYIPKLPIDPSGLQDSYRYYYDGGESDDYGYGLMARMEYSGNYGLVNDGGYYNYTSSGAYYEIGPEPAYDAQNGINWWND